MKIKNSTNYFFLLIFLLCAVDVRAQQAATSYKVGVVLPLTGDAASIGNSIKRGVDLAYEHLSEEEKKLVSIVYEDDQLSAKKSISAFQKLASFDKIDAVFVAGSGVGNALAPIAEQNKKVLLAIGASDKKVVENRRYAFTHWVSPEVESKIAVDRIVKNGSKRIAVVVQEQEGAIAVENSLVAEMKKRGLENSLVFSERVSGDTRDFKVTIAKIRSAKPDLIAVCILPGALGAFVKQARDLGITTEMFGYEVFEDANEVKVSDGALVGKWYVNSDNPSKEYADAYSTKYGIYPEWASANGYDALKLIVEAVKKNGVGNEGIADFLKSVKNYSGALGTYSATGDNRFDLPAAIKIVRENGFEKIGK